MQALKKFYFGKQKAKVNTYIGGIGGTINTPALLAFNLGISVNRIKLFKIIGLDIECAIVGGSYVIPANCWFNSGLITYYNDLDKLVTSIGDNAFRNCVNLINVSMQVTSSIGVSAFENTKIQSIDLTKVTIIKSNAFAFVNTLNGDIVANLCTSIENGAFYQTNIKNFTANLCTSVGNVAFAFCSEALTYNFPELLTIINSGTFVDNLKVTSIYIPKVTLIGVNNTTNNNVFQNIKTGCNITIPTLMQTINNGSVEPDVLYAVNSRGAIITYV